MHALYLIILLTFTPFTIALPIPAPLPEPASGKDLLYFVSVVAGVSNILRLRKNVIDRDQKIAELKAREKEREEKEKEEKKRKALAKEQESGPEQGYGLRRVT